MLYTIDIRIEVDATAFPYELKNIELAELVVESTVGCSLQDVFETVNMKEVTIKSAPENKDQDWDALLT
jgi:hypothetical protein